MSPPDENADGVPDVDDRCCCLPEDCAGFEDVDARQTITSRSRQSDAG
ncbi:MAG: hypothetical protein H6713_24910 [Myxococcales bacterium]|nr:hypothetical protein [Myxococcales bacterium]